MEQYTPLKPNHTLLSGLLLMTELTNLLFGT